MRSDVALGLITIAMAVLGGIVSAHAPSKLRHKCIYAVGFVLLAVVGIFFVIRLSNETAVANAKLSDALNKLESSTYEIERQAGEIGKAQAKNNELQAALLSQSAATSALSKEILAESTGGESFCFFLARPKPTPPYPLTLIVVGKHPMRNLGAEIQQSFGPGDSERQTQSMHWIPLGDSTKLPAAYPLSEQLGVGTYFFRILSANGMLGESLDLRLKDGNLSQSMTVSRNGKKLYEIMNEKVTVPYKVR